MNVVQSMPVGMGLGPTSDALNLLGTWAVEHTVFSWSRSMYTGLLELNNICYKHSIH
jgi:hypothetical protein